MWIIRRFHCFGELRVVGSEGEGLHLDQGFGLLDLRISPDAGERGVHVVHPSAMAMPERTPSTELSLSGRPHRRARSATSLAGVPSRKSTTRACGTAEARASPRTVTLVRTGWGAQAARRQTIPRRHHRDRIQTPSRPGTGLEVRVIRPGSHSIGPPRVSSRFRALAGPLEPSSARRPTSVRFRWNRASAPATSSTRPPASAAEATSWAWPGSSWPRMQSSGRPTGSTRTLAGGLTRTRATMPGCRPARASAASAESPTAATATSTAPVFSRRSWSAPDPSSTREAASPALPWLAPTPR
jgi:hypothetical protein